MTSESPGRIGGLAMGYILIVDDLKIIRELLEISLRGAGYQTRCASDGREALAAIQNEVPKLILLDLSMPIMGGLAVLEVLRAQPSTAKVPVILLTASGESETVMGTIQRDVQDYIQKSQFSVKELKSRVANIIGAPSVAGAGA
jgi:CheY-like chemotaxis protein